MQQRRPSVVRRSARLDEGEEVAVTFETPTLGFTLQSTEDELRPAIISEFPRGRDGSPGPAATCGVLSIGDSISRINQRPVIGMSYEDVCGMLRKASRPLLIHWRRAYARLVAADTDAAEIASASSAVEVAAAAAAAAAALPVSGGSRGKGNGAAVEAVQPPAQPLPLSNGPAPDLPWGRLMLPPMSHFAAAQRSAATSSPSRSGSFGLKREGEGGTGAALLRAAVAAVEVERERELQQQQQQQEDDDDETEGGSMDGFMPRTMLQGDFPSQQRTKVAAAIAMAMAKTAADSALDDAHTAEVAASELRRACIDTSVLDRPEVSALLALVLPRQPSRAYLRRWLRAVMLAEGDSEAAASGGGGASSTSAAAAAAKGGGRPGEQLGGTACRRGLQIEGVPASTVEHLTQTLMPLLAQAAAATGQQLLVFERERVVHDVRLRVESQKRS